MDLNLTDIMPDMITFARQSLGKRSSDQSEQNLTKKVRVSEESVNDSDLKSVSSVYQTKEQIASEVKDSDNPFNISSDEESDNGTKSNRKVSNSKSNTISTDEDICGQINDKLTNTCTESEEQFRLNQYKEMCDKLKPTLDVLILKGCFMNIDRKSTLIKEMWRFCAHTNGSTEMMIRNLTPFNLLAEQQVMDLCLKNCSRLKCLRLSYCEVDINLFRRLKGLKYLSCLHLEYIYGIESSEEWTDVGKILTNKLVNFSFASDYRRYDMSGMLSALGVYGELALEEYHNDMRQLFYSIYPNVYKLSLINYYDIDSIAVKALAERVSAGLRVLIVTYDKFHPKRANVSEVFANICRQMIGLKKLEFKLITPPDMRPIFKLKHLRRLDFQFSIAKFINFPSVYHLESLRHLSLSKVLLTPRRVLWMTKSFPYLLSLSLNGSIDRNHIDSAMFCCECRNKDKTLDTCPLCYQNCAIGLIELSLLERLELNYINIKPLLSTALPYIPVLRHLVINPFECQCGHSLLISVIKIAHIRPFKFTIRKGFIEEALKEESYLPSDLKIVEYDKHNDCDYY